jgi:phosphoribosyl-ATP pyrophosphohydrolase/phosphoribosyl-AMP cyclohydrolase
MKTKRNIGASLNWTKGRGLIPAVVQSRRTREVLMVGWMNREALNKTLDTGLVTFFSRSRKRLWTKGERSGHILRLTSIRKDCDNDTLLIEADAHGPTCHTGATSCFDKSRPTSQAGGLGFLEILGQTIADRFKKRPRGSYVSSLIRDGIDRIAQKVGEEAVEMVIAAKNASKERLESEAADLLFHLMVLLKARGTSLNAVAQSLKKRAH